MKILMINDYASKIGGDISYILNLKETLEKRNNVVKILSSDSRLGQKHFNHYKFKGFSKTSIFSALFYLFNPFSLFKLNELLKEFRPDVIHLHNIFDQASPSILLPLKNVPTVMTIHSYELICPNVLMLSPAKSTNICKTGFSKNCRRCIGNRYYYHKLKFALYKKLFKNVDLLIPNSKFVQRILNQKGYKTTETIHYGIKSLDFLKERDGNNILYVGRLSKEKGVKYILKALSLIIKKIPSVHLDIVGVGQERKELENLSKKLKLKNHVAFIGSVPYDEVEKYYKQANIVIVSSIWPEPFGLIGPEAMSVGRPVIASNVGGIPEWLDDGKTGFLVDPGHPDQIAEKVIKLFSDRKLLEEMGKNARKKAEEFSIEKHIDEIEKVYLEVIEKYKSKKTS